MDITVDLAGAGQLQNGGATLTFSHTCSGDYRVLIVTTSTVDGAETVSMTYGGVAMTKTIERNGGDYANCSIWHLVAPAVGDNAVFPPFPPLLLPPVPTVPVSKMPPPPPPP